MINHGNSRIYKELGDFFKKFPGKDFSFQFIRDQIKMSPKHFKEYITPYLENGTITIERIGKGKHVFIKGEEEGDFNEDGKNNLINALNLKLDKAEEDYRNLYDNFEETIKINNVFKEGLIEFNKVFLENQDLLKISDKINKEKIYNIQKYMEE